MRRAIQRAINEGIDEGFENRLASMCDGYHEPDERCPMRIEDGCACLRVRYAKLPWFRKVLAKAPLKTSRDAVLRALIEVEIDSLPTPPQEGKA
ncbi:MAG: hypothetical protein COA52_02455 [Hyphomicrobiales bacterium]|nr:MAG: hypothetical protein COA52_02455 [Hyphomicrobiales bacterium]